MVTGRLCPILQSRPVLAECAERESEPPGPLPRLGVGGGVPVGVVDDDAVRPRQVHAQPAHARRQQEHEDLRTLQGPDSGSGPAQSMGGGWWAWATALKRWTSPWRLPMLVPPSMRR